MPESSPLWLQAGTYSAELDRRLLAALTSYQGGVFAAGDLSVSADSPPGMRVKVSRGACLVQAPGNEGAYFCHNDGDDIVTLAAAASNPRKDIIVARVYDTEQGHDRDGWFLEAVAGIPSTTPAEPATPDYALRLATVDVPANASSISGGGITDRRIRLNTGAIGHSDAAMRQGPSPAWKSGSQTFTDWGASPPILTFTKNDGSSILLVEFGCSFFVSDRSGGGAVEIAVRVGNTDYTGLATFVNEQNSHVWRGGVVRVTGLAAGSHSIRLRMRVLPAYAALRLNADTFDAAFVRATETMP